MDRQGKDWNEGHPDHEGEMAVAQLHRLAEMAKEMLNIIGENDDLPGWIQYKITRAFNDLGDAFNYIEAQHHMDGEENQMFPQSFNKTESLRLIKRLVTEELRRNR